MNMKYYWPLNGLYFVLFMGMMTLLWLEMISKAQYFLGASIVIVFGIVVWTMNDRHRKKYREKIKASE